MTINHTKKESKESVLTPVSCISRYPSMICPWNCIIFNNTTVQKEIFVVLGKYSKDHFSPVFLRITCLWLEQYFKSHLVQTEKKDEKTKRFGTHRNGDSERSGSEFCRIQSQEVQVLGRSAVATTLITQTSGVTQSVDLTNKDMSWEIITWEMFTTFSQYIVWERTVSLTYISN
jgi:hypothetical protein